jgi:hypothetical protein
MAFKRAPIRETGAGLPVQAEQTNREKVAGFGRFFVADGQVIRYTQGTARRSHT